MIPAADLKTPILPVEAMDRIASARAESYRTAEPYPHIVLDDFFDPAVLDALLDEFPDAGGVRWIKYDDPNQVKLATRHENQLGPFTRYFIYHLNSATFLAFLEKLTGIEGLIPDPLLFGGGLHQILPGGKLAIHADFNRHPHLKLDRRLNLLVYLNKDWKEEYGGHFELWGRDMKTCERRVLPVFNRLVVFSTTDFSYHGHPDPLRCPEGRARRSLALYYYSNGRPAEEVRGAPHSTLFQARPGEASAAPPKVPLRKRWRKLRRAVKELFIAPDGEA